VLAFVEDEDRLTALWDEECRREVLRRAMSKLRETTRLDERTITAFQRQALEERTPAEIAAELEMSIDAVYKARQRCLAQLRTILLRLNAAYELSDGG